jgi:hypothetical protein
MLIIDARMSKIVVGGIVYRNRPAPILRSVAAAEPANGPLCLHCQMMANESPGNTRLSARSTLNCGYNYLGYSYQWFAVYPETGNRACDLTHEVTQAI